MRNECFIIDFHETFGKFSHVVMRERQLPRAGGDTEGPALPERGGASGGGEGGGGGGGGSPAEGAAASITAEDEIESGEHGVEEGDEAGDASPAAGATDTATEEDVLALRGAAASEQSREEQASLPLLKIDHSPTSPASTVRRPWYSFALFKAGSHHPRIRQAYIFDVDIKAVKKVYQEMNFQWTLISGIPSLKTPETEESPSVTFLNSASLVFSLLLIGMKDRDFDYSNVGRFLLGITTRERRKAGRTLLAGLHSLGKSIFDLSTAPLLAESITRGDLNGIAQGIFRLARGISHLAKSAEDFSSCCWSLLKSIGLVTVKTVDGLCRTLIEDDHLRHCKSETFRIPAIYFEEIYAPDGSPATLNRMVLDLNDPRNDVPPADAARP